MITLQIDSNDRDTIKEIREYIAQKFHLKASIIEVKNNDVEERLNALKSNTFVRKGNLAKAFSSLNKKLDNLPDIDIEKEKDEYLSKKYAL